MRIPFTERTIQSRVTKLRIKVITDLSCALADREADIAYLIAERKRDRELIAERDHQINGLLEGTTDV